MSTLKLKSKFNPIVQILNGNEKHQKANIKLLSNAITKGFKPKWYCVLHFNDGGLSNKQRFRRKQSDEVQDDLRVIKNVLYTELYGNKWHKKSTRAKSVWSVEYGDNPDKPSY